MKPTKLEKTILEYVQNDHGVKYRWLYEALPCDIGHDKLQKSIKRLVKAKLIIKIEYRVELYEGFAITASIYFPGKTKFSFNGF
jgi:hypothetical protein